MAQFTIFIDDESLKRIEDAAAREKTVAYRHWANAAILDWIAARNPVPDGIEDMILHAFSHGFHHAGQMVTLASKAGEKFPNVAYIAFTRAMRKPG